MSDDFEVTEVGEVNRLHGQLESSRESCVNLCAEIDRLRVQLAKAESLIRSLLRPPLGTTSLN